MAKKKPKHKVTKHAGFKIRHIGPETFMADVCTHGRRERKCWKTLKEAEVFCEQKQTEAQNKGAQAFDLTHRDRLDLLDARKKLGNTSLAEVVDFYLSHNPAGESRTISQLIDEYLAAPGKRGRRRGVKRRAATVRGAKWRLNAFAATFGDLPAQEVTTEDVEQWLQIHQWQGLNQRHYIANVTALYNFAIERNHVTVNPAARIDLPEVDSAEPDIMPTSDVGKLLRAAVKATPELVPRLAIGFFAGLRPEELCRLRWESISFDNQLITVDGSVAKVAGHRRIVTMSENLMQWLVVYARETGPVWQYASKTTLCRKLKAVKKEAKVAVPSNAGRHAFASYHLALYHDAARTAAEMGHSDSRLLRTRYLNIRTSTGKPITEKMGQAYFDIMPENRGQVLVYRQAG